MYIACARYIHIERHFTFGTRDNRSAEYRQELNTGCA